MDMVADDILCSSHHLGGRATTADQQRMLLGVWWRRWAVGSWQVANGSWQVCCPGGWQHCTFGEPPLSLSKRGTLAGGGSTRKKAMVDAM